MSQDITIGAVVQLVRIHACHAWGRGFESRPHRKKKQKCFFFCYILTTTSILSITGSWRVHNGFITGSYPTFPVTTPIPLRYHSEPLPKDLRRNSERRAKRYRALVVKNLNPISSVKKQVISQVIKWVCQTLTHPLLLLWQSDLYRCLYIPHKSTHTDFLIAFVEFLYCFEQ